MNTPGNRLYRVTLKIVMLDCGQYIGQDREGKKGAINGALSVGKYKEEDDGLPSRSLPVTRGASPYFREAPRSARKLHGAMWGPGIWSG